MCVELDEVSGRFSCCAVGCVELDGRKLLFREWRSVRVGCVAVRWFYGWLWDVLVCVAGWTALVEKAVLEHEAVGGALAVGGGCVGGAVAVPCGAGMVRAELGLCSWFAGVRVGCVAVFWLVVELVQRFSSLSSVFVVKDESDLLARVSSA